MIFGQHYYTCERESIVLAEKLRTVNPLPGITVSEGIRVLHLILHHGLTHARKQIKERIRSPDLPFRVKVQWLPIHASRLDQVEIVLSYVQRASRRGE